MTRSQRPPGRGRSIRLVVLLVAALATGGVAALTGLALAKSISTLGTSSISSLGETVVVDSSGHTLYELKPQKRPLLCGTKSCWQFWPPVKVSKNAKLTAATGIKGKLGKIHRGSFYQVTLGGVPVYRFAEDKKSGQANGNGIMSFGGTWHVISVGKASKSPTAGTTTTTSSTTTSSTYAPGW